MKNPAQTALRIVALAFLLQLALCWPLWNAGLRSCFPQVPVINLQILHNRHWIILHAWITVAILGLLFFIPGRRRVIAIALAWIAWMVMQDLNRLQPWVYFYWLLILIVYFDFSGRGGRTTTLPLQLFIAGVYAWSGFNKLTPYFAEDNFPWFCSAFTWTKSLGSYPVAGYGVALAECLLAPGLLWKQSRHIFRWIALGFHLFIAIALSPAGLDWNTVVIPWNLGMAALVWLLFSHNPPDLALADGKAGSISARQGKDFIAGFPGFLRQFNTGTLLVLGLVWIMPFFNIFHLWDEALSWKMYSNTQTEATYYSTEKLNCTYELHDMWEKYAFNDKKTVLLDDWALDELRVPAYNSQYAFEQIAQYLCTCRVAQDSTGLYLLQVNRWNKSAEKWIFYPCRLKRK